MYTFSGYIRDTTTSYQIVLYSIIAGYTVGLLSYAASMLAHRCSKNEKEEEIKCDFVTKF